MAHKYRKPPIITGDGDQKSLSTTEMIETKESVIKIPQGEKQSVLYCNGKRDRTAFIKKGEMNDSTIINDYHFLEDVIAKRRNVEPISMSRRDTGNATVKKNPLLIGLAKGADGVRGRSGQHVPSTHSLPRHLRALQETAVAEAGISIKFMPRGMSRGERNRSRLVSRRFNKGRQNGRRKKEQSFPLRNIKVSKESHKDEEKEMTSTENSNKSSGATISTPDREYILWTVGVVFHIPSENDETKTLSWKRYVITIDNVEGEHTLWKGASMCNAYGAVETISASKDVVGKALEQWRQIGDDENVHTLAQKNGGRRNKRSSTDPSASSELAATNDHAIEKILSGPPYNKMLTFENVRIMRQLKVPVSKGSTFASAPFTTCPSSTSLPLNFTSGSNVRYIRLDPTWTLHDAFRGTEVIEHPTIHVLLSSGKVNNKLLASSFPMLIQEVPRKILS